MISIQVLLVFMIASAAIAVEANDLFASVIALGVLGLELSLACLLLKSPDTAIILLVLEMIALAVLAKAVTKQGSKPVRDLDPLSSVTFIAFAVLFVTICVKAFAGLPAFGSPLMKLGDIYASGAVEKTGASNIVAAVMFNFRGLDTLIAAMLLLLTAIGIVHITDKKE